MKIIDLLNKIAKGEEVPKRFRFNDNNFIYDAKREDYIYEDGDVSFFDDYTYEMYSLQGVLTFMDFEIEVLEEVEDKEYEDIEVLEGTLLEANEDSNLDKRILCCLATTINALIRNQQKIIKQLENK